MMGMGGDENIADQMIGKVEGMLDVVRRVNEQFKNPEQTTFVAVCIPEFLSLYETERLVQELAKYEIDVRNIVINQLIFPEAASGSKLLEARVRMQQKYLQQFHDLYEDFHLVKLPLLEEEVRGVDALKDFSKNLMTPYKPPAAPAAGDKEAALQAEVVQLKARVAELEALLEAVGAYNRVS
eukprot:GHUV01032007.1.p1 GENE.GHUV01032007.1~~GHUV01032007.1.p1  ORF type:complete len:182 (+),score=49.97 GHUV01032007.1:205-750(+)